MKREEFGEMLTKQIGINVVGIILDNGIDGVLKHRTEKIQDMNKAKEWQIAKEIVEDCINADTLFYFLVGSANIARSMVAVDGFVNGFDLPHIKHK